MTDLELKFSTMTYPGYNLDRARGRHAVELVMAVVGSEGAVVWRLALGITPVGENGHTSEPNLTSLYNVLISGACDMGLTIHSELNERTATETEYSISQSCEFLEGRACVCEYHTGLKGKEFMPVFAAEGFEGVRKLLEKEYAKHYEQFSK